MLRSQSWPSPWWGHGQLPMPTEGPGHFSIFETSLDAGDSHICHLQSMTWRTNKIAYDTVLAGEDLTFQGESGIPTLGYKQVLSFAAWQLFRPPEPLRPHSPLQGLPALPHSDSVWLVYP